mmetsp:Transcript_23403/g.56737  ORF Transcript_23403/g.56737 Transcript_23403/m.56737 type:complete len:207 (-) Transcript_23403:1261-1881(-)
MEDLPRKIFQSKRHPGKTIFYVQSALFLPALCLAALWETICSFEIDVLLISCKYRSASVVDPFCHSQQNYFPIPLCHQVYAFCLSQQKYFQIPFCHQVCALGRSQQNYFQISLCHQVCAFGRSQQYYFQSPLWYHVCAFGRSQQYYFQIPFFHQDRAFGRFHSRHCHQCCALSSNFLCCSCGSCDFQGFPLSWIQVMMPSPPGYSR